MHGRCQADDVQDSPSAREQFVPFRALRNDTDGACVANSIGLADSERPARRPGPENGRRRI